MKSTQAPTDAIIAKLRDAVALIKLHDPRRFQRVRHDVSRIVALDLLLLAGTQWMRPRAILLKAEVVHQQPAIWAAAAIIHEATHIRLKQAGIRTTQANRGRIERRCVREQIDFLQSVAAQDSQYARDAEYYVEWSERSLESRTPWYTPEYKWLQTRAALVAESAPQWVLGLLDALRPPRVEEKVEGDGLS